MREMGQSEREGLAEDVMYILEGYFSDRQVYEFIDGLRAGATDDMQTETFVDEIPSKTEDYLIWLLIDEIKKYYLKDKKERVTREDGLKALVERIQEIGND